MQLIAGAVLLVWSIIGFRYKQLSEIDDILEYKIDDNDTEEYEEQSISPVSTYRQPILG